MNMVEIFLKSPNVPDAYLVLSYQIDTVPRQEVKLLNQE